MSVDEEMNVACVVVQGEMVRLEGVGHSAGIYVRRRAALALPQEPGDALIIDESGRPLASGGLQEFLRRSRSIRMNIMFNTSLCKGLFRTRYGKDTVPGDEEGEEL